MLGTIVVPTTTRRPPEDPEAATRLAMRALARRHREPIEELKVLDAQLARLVGETAPDMVARHGVGPPSAALSRLRTDARTQTYAQKKTAEEEPDREIMRLRARVAAPASN